MSIDEEVARWRAAVSRRAELGPDVDELEAHLRDGIDRLVGSGLSEDEAFLIAVQRLGSTDELSREFAREHSERLWKQLMGTPGDGGTGGFGTALAFAVAAGLAVCVPSLAGAGFSGAPHFWAMNAATVVLAFLTGSLAARRVLPVAAIGFAVAAFAAAFAVLNLYPFTAEDATGFLSVAHAAVALWLVVGVVYASGDWRSSLRRMDFVRFTGEWVVYLVLIGLGGGVLVGLTVGVFGAVGVDVETFVADWMLPGGVAGAVVLAAWLVERKQAVIENIAPVLTWLFTPLFTLLLVALLVAGAIQQDLVGDARELLILFDAVLVVVVGLLLYSWSARPPGAPPRAFDALQAVLLVAALLVDLVVLGAMVGRVGEFGMSANKAASLGLNVILLVNLAGSLVLHARFLRGRGRFAALEHWQTGFLPVYLGWAAIVAITFPPLFDFV